MAVVKIAVREPCEDSYSSTASMLSLQREVLESRAMIATVSHVDVAAAERGAREPLEDSCSSTTSMCLL